MATGSSEAGSGPGIIGLDLREEVARASQVIASFVERPLATIDEMQDATAAFLEENTELLLQLRSRLKRRGDRA